MTIRLLSATLRLNKNGSMLYKQLQFCDYENHALLSTGATQSSMSECELQPIFSGYPSALLKEMPLTRLQTPDLKQQHYAHPETSSTSIFLCRQKF